MKAPSGSALNRPEVRAALKGLGECAGAAGVGMENRQRPDGSYFGNAKVGQALQGLAATDMTRAAVGADGRHRPDGSYLGNAKVGQALQGLAAMDMTRAAVGADGRHRPDGSYLGSAKVGQALQGLAAMDMTRAAVGADGRHGPDGSYFGDEKTARSLNELGSGQGGGVPGGQGNGAVFTAHNALNGGELSPHMLARFDQPRYQTGCEVLENMVPLSQGGITRRPGLSPVGTPAHDGSDCCAVRLIPFVFSADQSRMLEFSGHRGSVTMRVWGSDGKLIRLENGEPFTLELPGWRAEDLAGLSTAQSADVIFTAHRNHPPARICRYGDTDWRYEVINWMPSIEAPVITSIRAVGEIPQGENSRTSYSYVATAIDGQTGEESLPSAVAVLENVAPLSQTYHVEITVGEVPGASEYRIYKKKGGVFGYVGRIVATTGTV